MDAKEKARDRHYRTEYGIGLEDYDRMLAQQDGKCAICRRPPVNNRLSVDHCHKHRYIKIGTQKLGGFGWGASSHYLGSYFCSVAETRNEAVRQIRTMMKKASVRGLLDFQCNSALRKFSDDPVRLENAAAYLRKHQQSKGETQ